MSKSGAGDWGVEGYQVPKYQYPNNPVENAFGKS